MKKMVVLLVVLALLLSITPYASAETANRLRISYGDYPTPFYLVFNFNKKITEIREQYLAPGPDKLDKKSGLEELVVRLMKVEGIDYVKVSPYEIMAHASIASEPWSFKKKVQDIVKDYFRNRGYKIRFFSTLK